MRLKITAATDMVQAAIRKLLHILLSWERSCVWFWTRKEPILMTGGYLRIVICKSGMMFSIQV